MGAIAKGVKRFLAASTVAGSRFSSFFHHNHQLHTSRFGRLHEHASLLTQSPEEVTTGLLFTTWNVKLFFRLSWTEVLQGHKDL
jgi:hypothetical protein